MNIGQLIAVMSIDVSGVTAAITTMTEFEKQATKSINTISQRFRTFGYLASATITAPILAAGRASFKAASDYEYSIQKIVGLTGEAQSSVNELSKEILTLAPAFGKKPQELAEGLYYILSSGIKGAQAMDVLKLSAKAAAAGMGDTQTMANVLTSTLNAYRGTGLTAAYATDVLVAAVREGKAEASGFSTSLGQIVPIAAQLGLSFDQLAGGMAAITLTGASSANAAVYLKGVFNSLLTASTKGEKALKSVGSSYADLRKILSEQGLVALMQKLNDIQSQYGDEILSDVLPNVRALTGYLSFAGKNFKYNTELMKRVTESTGALGEAWGAVANTIKIRYDQAIASINSSMISLGKSIAQSALPLLEKLSTTIQKITENFNSLSESQRQHRIKLLALIAALGPLSLAISVVGYTLSGVITIFSNFARAAIYTTALVKGLTGSFSGLKAALTVNAALTKGIVRYLANPWVLLGAAVAGVTLAVIRHYSKMKELRKEYDSFYTTAIKVNGELAKLNTITPQQVTTMSMDELASLYDTLNTEEAIAKEKWSQYKALQGEVDGSAKLVGRAKQYQKLMDDETQKVLTIQKLRKETVVAMNQLSLGEGSISSSLDEQQELRQRLIAQAEEQIKQTERHREALSKLNDEYREQNKELERQSRLAFQAQEPIDYQRFFMRTSPYGGEKSGFMEQLDKELAKSLFMNSMVGDSYDVLSGQIDAYKNAIEELYSMDLYQKGNQNAIAIMDQLIAKYKELYAQQQNLKDSEDALKSLGSVFSYLGGIIGGTFEKWVNWVEDLVRVMPDIIKIVKLITNAKKAETAEVLANTTAQAANATSMAATVAASTGVALATRAESVAEAGSAISGATNAGAGLPFPYNIVAMETGVAAALKNLGMMSIAEGMAAKMAKGGTVPPGYPNDTYLALLSSGEKVTPPGKLSDAQIGEGLLIHIEGESKIKSDHIVISYDQRVRTRKKF